MFGEDLSSSICSLRADACIQIISVSGVLAGGAPLPKTGGPPARGCQKLHVMMQEHLSEI